MRTLKRWEDLTPEEQQRIKEAFEWFCREVLQPMVDALCAWMRNLGELLLENPPTEE